MADGDGNLAFVEIDCCSNSSPVPDEIVIVGEPYHVSASRWILPDNA
jgi:hypothetical protein